MDTIKNETVEDFVARINKLTQKELSKLGRTRESYLTDYGNALQKDTRYDKL